MTVKAQSDDAGVPSNAASERSRRKGTKLRDEIDAGQWPARQVKRRGPSERQTRSNDGGRQVLGGSDFIWLTSSDRGRYISQTLYPRRRQVRSSGNAATSRLSAAFSNRVRSISQPTAPQSAPWQRPQARHSYSRGPRGPSRPQRPLSGEPRSSPRKKGPPRPSPRGR